MEKTHLGPPPEHAALVRVGHVSDPTAINNVPRACKNCAWYGVLDVMTAICRLEPPKLLPIRPRADGQPGWESVVAWPDISPETDWCSHFVGVRNWTTVAKKPSEIVT